MIKLFDFYTRQQTPLKFDSISNPDDLGDGEVYEVIKAYFSHLSENSIKTYMAHLKVFLLFFNVEFGTAEAAEKMREIGRREALKFFNAQFDEPGQKPRDGINVLITATTINQRIDCLRRIYGEFVDAGLVEKNPFPKNLRAKISVEQKRPTNLIPYHFVEELLEAPDITTKGLRDRALLALLFGSGLRVGEIVKLKLEQINYTNKCINNVHTKGGMRPHVLLNDLAFSALQSLCERRSAIGVFEDTFILKNYRMDGTAPPGHINVRTANRIFKKYIEAVGLDPKQYSPHSARATAITKLLDDGFTHREVRAFSGHVSVRMVERYDKNRFADENNPTKKLTWK